MEEALAASPDADFADAVGGAGGEAESSVAGPSDAGGGAAALPPVEDTQFQVSLSAGAVDDNADFEAFRQYQTDYQRFVGLSLVTPVDVSERHIIRVTNGQGYPVLGAEILIYAGQNLVTAIRTPATGVVYFHPLAYRNQDGSYAVTVSKGQSTAEFELDRAAGNEWSVTLDVTRAQEPVQLDVLFLLDATGSMGDEIDQLKDNILSISAQVNALPGNPNVRFGMVTYRDEGDAYITRVVDFTGDVQAFQSALQNVQAGGGGDEPEALNEGLADAINGMNWRVDNTVSLVFLVADAPPQMGRANVPDYSASMQDALELGIKIHPIASSGLSSQGEYIFRQIAQYTGGFFIFLTYEETPQSSGDPGRDDLSVTEGTYSVEDLDGLVVRLIREEIEALFKTQ
jgi:Mg-chelatase subunit ChlD